MRQGLDCVAIARSWLGTPFHANTSVKGVGADCAGLIEGVARELGRAYPARSDVANDLVCAARTCLVETLEAKAGNIILLATQPTLPPVHAAIVTDTNTIIHAHWRAGVVENRFGKWFAARITHVFAWPQLETKSPSLSWEGGATPSTGTSPWHP